VRVIWEAVDLLTCLQESRDEACRRSAGPMTGPCTIAHTRTRIRPLHLYIYCYTCPAFCATKEPLSPPFSPQEQLQPTAAQSASLPNHCWMHLACPPCRHRPHTSSSPRPNR
jgi:hypothetical protein